MTTDLEGLARVHDGQAAFFEKTAAIATAKLKVCAEHPGSLPDEIAADTERAQAHRQAAALIRGGGDHIPDIDKMVLLTKRNMALVKIITDYGAKVREAGDADPDATETVAAILALFRSSPAPGREEIARVIDPDAWLLFENANVLTMMRPTVSEWRVAPSLTKADAILALFHAPADPGGGEDEGAVRTAGAKLLTALERYGFPVSDAASTAAMSVEARDLHNAARRFKIAITSTKRAADEPAVTNGQ